MSFGNNDDDDHFLAPFLQKRLPELGLDYETYGTYLQAETLTDESEWEDVLELLKASSETHGDDEKVWIDLQHQVEKLTKEHQEEKLLKEERDRKAQNELEHELLKREIALAQEKQKLDEEEHANATSTSVDEHKRALVARYAYEEEGDDEENGDGEGATEGGEKELSNREVAAQAHLAKAQQLRQQSTTTKKEEREKTKQTNEAKAQAKEERRKRATKSERRR